MFKQLHLSLLVLLMGLFSMTSVWSATQDSSQNVPGKKKTERDARRQQKKSRTNKKESRSRPSLTYHLDEESIHNTF